jgi:hypothetical protein
MSTQTPLPQLPALLGGIERHIGELDAPIDEEQALLRARYTGQQARCGTKNRRFATTSSTKRGVDRFAV